MKGEIKVYNSKDGELLKDLDGHNDTVTAVRIDEINKLFVSGSLDGYVFIYEEKINGSFNKLRELKIRKEV